MIKCSLLLLLGCRRKFERMSGNSWSGGSTIGMSFILSWPTVLFDTTAATIPTASDQASNMTAGQRLGGRACAMMLQRVSMSRWASVVPYSRCCSPADSCKLHPSSHSLCRYLISRSYKESVNLLYSANVFDFRRTDSLIRLPKVILPHRTQQIRRIQFSTGFACYHPENLPPGLPADFWNLPDDRRQWPAACEVLASLRHLQQLRINIVIMCRIERHRHPPDQAFFPEILEPLKAVHASDFTVEVSEPVSLLQEQLGATPFLLLEREPPVCTTFVTLCPSADKSTAKGEKAA